MGHLPLAVNRPLAVSPVPPDPPTPPALGLSGYDQAAFSAFFSGSPEAVAELVEDVRLQADALATGGTGARVRLLARSAAAARAELRALEGLLAQCVARQNFAAVASIDKAVLNATKRMVLLTKAIATEEAVRRRPSVTLTRSESITFSGVAR